MHDVDLKHVVRSLLHVDIKRVGDRLGPLNVSMMSSAKLLFQHDRTTFPLRNDREGNMILLMPCLCNIMQSNVGPTALNGGWIQDGVMSGRLFGRENRRDGGGKRTRHKRKGGIVRQSWSINCVVLNLRLGIYQYLSHQLN